MLHIMAVHHDDPTQCKYIVLADGKELSTHSTLAEAEAWLSGYQAGFQACYDWDNDTTEAPCATRQP